MTWVFSRPAGIELTKTEVTVSQYEACLTDGPCKANSVRSGGYCNRGLSGRDDHPINCVNWSGASSFCGWAGGRLPTADEWFAEASDGGRRMYPWGNDKVTCKLAVMSEGGAGCGKDRTWPVCSKELGNSVSGLCDMSGNVWEWTNNEEAGERVVRGGGWYYLDQGNVRASARFRLAPSGQYYVVGFRCARSSPQ